VTRATAFLIFVMLSANVPAAVVDVAPQRGRAVPSIKWIDENGKNRELAQFSGYPLILLPIYTRCRGTCVQNVTHLKKVLADSSADPRQFRILLFSFDQADHAAALARYRERENIPLGWSIGSASQGEIDALLDTIGFQVGKAGSEFLHPNMLVVLDSNLRVAKWINGTDYSSRDIDLALSIAAGKTDWIGRYSEWLYVLLLLAGSVLCVALCYSLIQLKARQESNLSETVL
jgi:cytochrome oxidase Cu insertion factor (SCO1/SenC/PrrC family)